MIQQHSTREQVLPSRVMNILIVDDRPENLLTMESILEREGRRILTAGGGNDALRLAIREEIGLILMDIQMPEIDGVEVARLLRSNNRTRHIPIIFVSAVTGPERPVMEGFEEGTVDWLSKPLNMDETKHKVALIERMYHMWMDRTDALRAAESIAREHTGFVSKVGQDLKSPMRAIHNLSNWILEDLSGSADANVRENLSLMKNRVLRLNSMLDIILEYEACGSLTETPEQLDLSKLIHAVFESLSPPTGFRIETGPLPEVTAGSSRIYKILYQLLSNAVSHHHNPANGRIRVTCDLSEGHYIIRVCDNGPGIKPQYATKVFELFVTLQASEDGGSLGAGLALAKRLAEGMGQHLWLENNTGSTGSVFCFTLDREDPQNLK